MPSVSDLALLRGPHVGNSAPIWPLRLRCYSVRPDLCNRCGNRELPIYGCRDVRRALVAIVVHRLGDDVAHRAVCRARHSSPDAHLDARRLAGVIAVGRKFAASTSSQETSQRKALDRSASMAM